MWELPVIACAEEPCTHSASAETCVCVCVCVCVCDPHNKKYLIYSIVKKLGSLHGSARLKYICMLLERLPHHSFVCMYIVPRQISFHKLILLGMVYLASHTHTCTFSDISTPRTSYITFFNILTPNTPNIMDLPKQLDLSHIRMIIIHHFPSKSI